MASGAKPEVIKKLHLIEILHKEAQAVLIILGRLFLSICLYLQSFVSQCMFVSAILCFSVYVCICNPYTLWPPGQSMKPERSLGCLQYLSQTVFLCVPCRRCIWLPQTGSRRSRRRTSCHRCSRTSWTSAWRWMWRRGRALRSCSRYSCHRANLLCAEISPCVCGFPEQSQDPKQAS